MNIFKRKRIPQERRQYIRIDTVFPVQFRLLSIDGKHFMSEWLQGFTNNVGKGGICLEVNNLNPELAALVKDKQVKFSLDIETSLNHMPIGAEASVRWVKDVPAEPNKYSIGLMYEDINQAQNNQVMRYAWTKKLFLPAVVSIIIVLSSGSILNTVISARLLKGNRILIEQLIKILQESSIAKQKVKEISKEKQELQLKLQALSTRIQNIEEETRSPKTASPSDIGMLNSYAEKLVSQRQELEQQLSSVQQKESAITQELLRLDKRKMAIGKTNLDKMYRWLKTQQNQRTGLVESFQGDSEVSNRSYVYDQALAAIVFTYFSDLQRAEMILRFFQKKAMRLDGSFLNVYLTAEGKPAEYAVSTGSNIWLGIAIAQYAKKSGDSAYLGLAEEIADLLIYLEHNSKEGGIPLVPGESNFSFEQNLDAYAFFDMLYKITLKKEYLEARDRLLDWLVGRGYGKMDMLPKGPNGDPGLVVEGFAWAIAAIGPNKMEEMQISADRVLEITEKNYAISVDYARLDGSTVRVNGFDFACAKNAARGKVVSSESTAKMVLLYKIITDFYYQKDMVAKARAYESKADMYLAELANMITFGGAPAHTESSLPYATRDSVDTGHGWITPDGHSCCCVSGTVYTLFSYYNFNPLELKE